MFALCEDESVIGRAFYVMEFVEGRVLWDQSLPGMTPAERAAIYDEMNRVIAALHTRRFAAIGLADYGKPGNYFARQIDRWSKQYQASETEPIDAMDRLIEWLPQHIPAERGDATVDRARRLPPRQHDLPPHRAAHPGGARLGAVDAGPPARRLLLSLHGWHIDPGQFRGIGGLDLAALGIPDEAAIHRTLCERTGSTIHGDWNFYLAYNMFRIAAIMQGIMKRDVDGTAASAQALDAGRARPMAELAWRYAQKVRDRRSQLGTTAPDQRQFKRRTR